MYSYVLDGENTQYFAFKGVKDTSIARHCDDLLSGKIKFIISDEIVFKNMCASSNFPLFWRHICPLESYRPSGCAALVPVLPHIKYIKGDVYIR